MTLAAKDGSATVVDCGSVEEYDRILAEACGAGKPVNHAALLDAVNEMDREQFRHLAVLLTAKADYYARLWKSSFSSGHAAMVAQMRDLRRMAKEQGTDLWPELE
jgi:hypothetical protein